MFYYTPFIIQPLVSAAVCGVLAAYALRKKESPAAKPLFWLMLILAGWSLSYAFNTASVSLAAKVFFFKVGTLFAAFSSVATLAMTLQVMGAGHWLTRRRLLVLSAPPAAAVLLAWTAEFHTLFRYDFTVVQSGPLLVLNYKVGPAWLPYFIYLNAMLLASVVLFFIGFRQSPSGFRARFLLLILGTMAPILVQHLGVTPYRGFDMVTSTFWFTGGCYTLAIFRLRLLDVAPIARAALFDQLVDPVLVFDLNGSLADYNNAARELLRPGAAGLVELNASALARFPVLQKLSDEAAPVFEDSLKDGLDEERYWMMKCLPLTRGIVRVGHLVQFHDVSRLKLSEEELRQARDAADSASRAKSVFLANMSHEIRTPMNAIIGFTNLVLDSDLQQEQKRYLEIVKNSSEALLAILNDIMDFSKIEAGKMEMEEVDFDLRKLVETSTRTLVLQAENKGLSLQNHIGSDVPAVLRGDPLRLKQVLLNLAGNAIKFTDRGEVTITVQSLPERKGQAPYALTPSFPLLFCIADTGIGIPEDKRDSIFTSFSQADSSITRKYGGTGLGLSISRQLVRLMGGDLKVESTVGRGSSFSFTANFSLGDQPIDTTLLGEGPGAAAGWKKMNVLVVEDIATNRMLAARLLEKRGHTVTTLDTGRKALELLSRESFDIILMDVQMPEMDGYETTRNIRDHQSPVITHDTPIIALTAHALTGDKERCIASGMNGYIAKPIDPHELITAVERHGYVYSVPLSAPRAGMSFADQSASGPGTRDTADRAQQDRSTAGSPENEIRQALLKKFSDDTALVEELLAVFRMEIPVLVHKIKDALTVRDQALLEQRAHACKSAVGTVGLASSAELARNIENAAKAGDIEGAGIYLQRLESELDPFLHR